MKKRVLLMLVISVLSLMAASAFDAASIPEVLGRLTLEQKARLLVGAAGSDEAPSHVTAGAAGWTYAIPSLGIPGVNLADGPVGPRINPMPWIKTRVVYDSNGLPAEVATTDAARGNEPSQWCTAFPSTAALAATFDPVAARIQGEAMGAEAAAYGIDILLAPGVNIIRNPLCGRNFEYYSEDPLLTGVLAAALVEGIQSQGVGACLKHFVANNQQTGKKVNDPVMSQRALREIYLPAFERVVKKARPWTMMGSYNRIAGQFTQTNQELNKRLLRDEWGYDGLLLTDWTVRRPTADLLNARTALMMPGDEEIVTEIIEAVNNGSVSVATLDSCVTDVLTMVARTLSARGWTPSVPDLDTNAALSRQIGAEGMVLLKNDANLLPLAPGSRVALFGTSAYQSIAGGTGSSNVNKRYVVDIDSGLIAAGYNIDPTLAQIYRTHNATQATLTDSHPGCPAWQKISYHRPVIDEMDLGKASTLIGRAADANDVAVIVLGRKSGETSDRTVDNDFNLTEAERVMIKSVTEAFAAAGKQTVLVLNVCGPVATIDWADLPDAILVAWFPGQECGHAVADVLSGRVNPCGRLPMTWYKTYADVPTAANYPRVGQTEGRNFDYTLYDEDIWLGYRNPSTEGVAFPFGAGMSYTEFAYSNLKTRRRGDTTLVDVTVTNTGNRPGREVVQLYVTAPATTMSKPEAELRGFTKTPLLAPGESYRATIAITDRDLASFNQDKSRWETEAGRYPARTALHADGSTPSVTFEIKKPRVYPVADILRPVDREVYTGRQPTANMQWHEAADFGLLGRVYPDSLPLYSRIPAFLRDSTRSARYDLGQQTAGMAVTFSTDSPRLALDWQNTSGQDMTHIAALASRGADLYWLASDSTWRFLAPARPMGNPTTWLMIDNMPRETRQYLLHLPLYDGLKYCRIGIDPTATIGPATVDFPRRDVKPVVIYGSSIAQGAAASRPGMVASNILRRETGVETINLGFSANAHLDYEIARMMADVDASVYVLDFVPNATVHEINSRAETFVKILRERRPDVPLIFIEDPYFTHSQLDSVIRATIDAKNAAIRRVYEKMKAAGMDNTYYITTDLLLPADGDGSSDSIHFTDRGFRTYCDALLPVLRKICF
ncbi:MAG: glycoside hydrolase family 3 C-terminal domain-containing protein, partial [Muribaculaceae bacterium]|nr:glycoside hydrolase family 3 C-terminal domain-containing protein [Muribaculaceae bacterium]